MKKITGTLLTVFLAAFLSTGCAKEEETVSEEAPGKIEEFNQSNADAMVKKIRTPIDKARLTKGLGDTRTEEMDKALADQ
jgi:hypothetical protein